MSTIRQNAKTEDASQVENIDFKMVTFSLAGKEYGIDIMKVKEISKANRFTFVPNSAPFVKGVYNLRGDIISVIDFRVMFHLPAQEKEDGAMEDMIILRLEELQIGVIVDSIDKVVGINSETIQPPHPIFGDINIKFIKGVVENESRLYLILDVERILGQREDDSQQHSRPEALAMVSDTRKEDVQENIVESPVEEQGSEPEKGVDFSFIVDTLKTFRGFYVSPVNLGWTEHRFEQWKQERGTSEGEVQLQSPEDADLFLRSFYSDATGTFFPSGLKDAYLQLFKEMQGERGQISVWNPGCGRGYESYSLAAAVKEAFPEKGVKVWAHDKDLLSISTAPNLLFQEQDVQDYLQPYVVQGKNGMSFTQVMKDMVLFEYHDILHGNPFPDVDIIFARDIASFLNRQDQDKLLRICSEKLRVGGVLIPGKNERLTGPEWEPIEQAGLLAYRKIR
jgi:purine-binding chemotaxis protein CheW